MKFMLLCYDHEQSWQDVGQAVLKSAMNDAVALTHELHAKGQYVTASPLHPAATATSVKIRDGRRIVTDGPFAETREVLGGYYIIDVPTLQDAIEIAARHPGQRFGGVEIREILDLQNRPQ
jgi:hypothetical protein